MSETTPAAQPSRWHVLFGPIASAVFAVFGFLFAQWINASVSQRMYELRLEMSEKYVSAKQLNESINPMRESIERMSVQMTQLQRVIDQKFGDEGRGRSTN